MHVLLLFALWNSSSFRVRLCKRVLDRSCSQSCHDHPRLVLNTIFLEFLWCRSYLTGRRVMKARLCLPVQECSSTRIVENTPYFTDGRGEVEYIKVDVVEFFFILDLLTCFILGLAQPFVMDLSVTSSSCFVGLRRLYDQLHRPSSWT